MTFVGSEVKIWVPAQKRVDSLAPDCPIQLQGCVACSMRVKYFTFWTAGLTVYVRRFSYFYLADESSALATKKELRRALLVVYREEFADVVITRSEVGKLIGCRVRR